MSSSLRSAGSPAAGVSCEVRPPPDVVSPSTFCEKNWSNEKPCDVRGVREPSRNTLSRVSSPDAGRVGLPAERRRFGLRAERLRERRRRRILGGAGGSIDRTARRWIRHGAPGRALAGALGAAWAASAVGADAGAADVGLGGASSRRTARSHPRKAVPRRRRVRPAGGPRSARRSRGPPVPPPSPAPPARRAATRPWPTTDRRPGLRC